MLMELKDVTYTYSPGTVHEVNAIEHVNIQIDKGEFIIKKINCKGTPIKGGVEIIGVAVLQSRVAFLQKYGIIFCWQTIT